MNDLVAIIIAVGEAAVADELFDDAGTVAEQTTPTFYDSFLQKNAPGHLPKKEHPFVLVRPVGCDDAEGKSKIFVPIQCGIHTFANTDNGIADIRRLVGSLREGFKDSQQFEPYGLDRIITTLGDPQDGSQPHPKYYANMELTFSRQALLHNY